MGNEVLVIHFVSEGFDYFRFILSFPASSQPF
ncbi:MAG: hypothetical protein XU15_C0037G0001, partial [candidate division NC10 bacterium CSP1-5]